MFEVLYKDPATIERCRLAPLLEDRERYLCAVVVSGVVGDIARGVARTQLALVSLATTNIYAEVDLRAKEEAMKSTCPGDAGDEPRWKARGDLLEQLKAIWRGKYLCQAVWRKKLVLTVGYACCPT